VARQAQEAVNGASQTNGPDLHRVVPTNQVVQNLDYCDCCEHSTMLVPRQHAYSAAMVKRQNTNPRNRERKRKRNEFPSLGPEHISTIFKYMFVCKRTLLQGVDLTRTRT